MKYTNSYFPDVILDSSAKVKELQENNPDPRNFFWVLSDLTVDTEVVETNDYNDLDNKPDLSAYLPVGTEHNDLPGIQGGAPGDYQHVTQSDIDHWNSLSYYVHVQSTPSTNWTFANPLARKCNINLYDSANNDFLADVLFSSDNLTITITLAHAKIGTAVLG